MLRRRFSLALLSTATVGSGLVPTSSARASSPSYTLSVRPSSATRGEDGRGRVTAATNPRTLDVVAPAPWLVRATDPMLYIGGLRFGDYTHVGKYTLRFTAADVALLSEGDEVYVQYGQDRRTRVTLAPLGKVR